MKPWTSHSNLMFCLSAAFGCVLVYCLVSKTVQSTDTLMALAAYIVSVVAWVKTGIATMKRE